MNLHQEGLSNGHQYSALEHASNRQVLELELMSAKTLLIQVYEVLPVLDFSQTFLISLKLTS